MTSKKFLRLGKLFIAVAVEMQSLSDEGRRFLAARRLEPVVKLVQILAVVQVVVQHIVQKRQVFVDGAGRRLPAVVVLMAGKLALLMLVAVRMGMSVEVLVLMAVRICAMLMFVFVFMDMIVHMFVAVISAAAFLVLVAVVSAAAFLMLVAVVSAAAFLVLVAVISAAAFLVFVCVIRHMKNPFRIVIESSLFQGIAKYNLICVLRILRVL